MHPLHEYVAKQLAERLKGPRPVVVWYDVRREFGRLGVPVVRAMQRESMQLILDRMEQLRVAGIRRHSV